MAPDERGLPDEVDGARAHGAHDQPRVLERGHGDDHRVGVLDPDLLEQGEPVGARHVQVEEDDLGMKRRKDRHPLGSGGGGEHAERPVPEETGEVIAAYRVTIDDQNGRGHEERLLLDGEPGRPGYSGRDRKMRILVVDDEPSVAQVIAEAVQARGDAALVCLDATEAIELLETTKVDGVFMDLVMPGLGGLAALARIRSRHPKLPVVIFSGHADEDQVREASELGSGRGGAQARRADPSHRSARPPRAGRLIRSRHPGRTPTFASLSRWYGVIVGKGNAQILRAAWHSWVRTVRNLEIQRAQRDSSRARRVILSLASQLTI